MPKLQFKEPTLNGRAYIMAYADREYLYLRIPRGNKKYSNISLETTDLKIAHDKALDVYAKAINEPARTVSRRFGFDKACSEFLSEKYKQVERGQIKHSSVSTYEQRIYQRIIPYAKQCDVKSVSDISQDTFEGYGNFYLDVKEKGKWKSEAKGLSAATINGDLTTLRELVYWLIKKGYIGADTAFDIPKIKDRKNYREEANPAFLPDEFKKFKDVLYLHDIGCKDEEDKWKKRWFIHWVLFQYHTGCRCHETRQITVGDTDVQKRPDGNVKGIVDIRPTTKTGKRTVIMNGNTLRKIKTHLNKGIKLRNAQITEHNALVESGEIKNFKWRKQEKIPLIEAPSKDTLLMANPFSSGMNVYTDESIRAKFNSILKQCDFDKKYTLHSLRSTHITHSLLKGVRIRVIADNVGNSEAEIERTYYRLNNLLNIDELGFHKSSEGKDLVVGD